MINFRWLSLLWTGGCRSTLQLFRFPRPIALKGLLYLGPFPLVQVDIAIGGIIDVVVFDIVPLTVHPILHGPGIDLIIRAGLGIVHRFLPPDRIDVRFMLGIASGTEVPKKNQKS